MKKQRFQYGISGYRWAPESFQVIKGLPGQKKTAVPLTHEERSEVGRRFLTGAVSVLPAGLLPGGSAPCRTAGLV